MQKLTIEIKRAYGHERYYPGCAKSRVLVKLTGKVCFTEDHLDLLKELGYEIQYKGDH